MKETVVCADAGLVRSFRRWDLVAVTVNAVIGAGIFGLPSRVYGLAGAYSLPAFLLCGVFTGMIVLCFAEVGSRFRETGGPYLYAGEAFGPAVGFTIGWLTWIARIAAFAANTSILLGYLGLFWPEIGGRPRFVVICGVILVLATINLLGVRDVAVATNLFTVGKLAPLVLLIVAGFWYLNPRSFALGAAPSPHVFSEAMLLLVYAYTGFEMAAIPAAEMRDPQRDLPVALLFGIGVVALFYILIQAVCIGALPGLSASDRPLADAAARFLGSGGAAIISAGAVISIAGNLNVVVLSASRLPFAMARRGELPAWLGAIHGRFHTPHMAIFVTTALMGALTLSGTFLYAVTVSTIARLVIYGTTCAALPVLRRRTGAPSPPFRVTAGVPISMLTLALASWLLWNTTWRELRDTAIAAAVGWVLYGLSKKRAAEGRIATRP
ncbi:MAG TPA: amino acid permease [Bryobacteraceae bacterium]|nr:amino acid permease [Bryobacteraceae bacterium]